MLDDESKMRNPSLENFGRNLRVAGAKHSAFALPRISSSTNTINSQYCFIIRHFARNVCYSAVSFSYKFNENFIEVLKQL